MLHTADVERPNQSMIAQAMLQFNPDFTMTAVVTEACTHLLEYLQNQQQAGACSIASDDRTLSNGALEVYSVMSVNFDDDRGLVRMLVAECGRVSMQHCSLLTTVLPLQHCCSC